ncbi:hypothetical protein JX265_010011 [Neoarthrinium moseri]|uniref:Tubby C-terminal-like domain-containing protein n=1 Tax=Neoarthrinium moseri TaxID=1658444 RepID=A0A9P9WF17_9PEZI|nr:uncharacterized protein JN550_012039 [Neoarthrinium moseri]KAI1844494.1 hypothetical protein JX266_009381 [Neoarthrinium moseri]KAI1859521.1 hypothetical protein JN550_012039 [Neoarthrinium moseri]KAI1860087.1 hypothetical protein JX265_010011 [Neoarthrinium moseri]
MVELAPYPTPLGIFAPFFARKSETLVIKEKVLSLSGDSFDIKTVDGRPIFQVKGSAWSLSGRKMVCDMGGNHLFTIRKKHLAIHSTYYAEDPNGNQFFDVTSKFSIGSSKAYGNFVSATGKQERLFMKGDFFDRSADITDAATKQPVATIRRQFLNARELIAGQQTYEVTIAPNVDMAVIVAMCICLDEKRNEK